MSERRYAYVGSNTRLSRQNKLGEEPYGLTVFSVDAENGSLEPVQRIASDNPFFLAAHPSGRFAYVVNLVSDFEGNRSGSVEAYAIDPASGQMTLLNRQSSRGADPCHLAVDPGGRFVTVANYAGGSWVVLPIDDDGTLGHAVHIETRTGSGPNTQRQEMSHPHAITYTPDGRFLIGADLGTDRVIVFRLDTETGRLHTINEARLAPGAGPRHVAFDATGTRLYVLNELNATITLFPFDPATGSIGDEIQSVLTVQPEAVGPMTTAEVMLHPGGKWLYNSNRGQPLSLTPESDALVGFRIEAETGKLELIGHMVEEIGVPWNFAFNAKGTTLYAPNFEHDSITLYDIDLESGSLTYTGVKYHTPKPFCIIMHP